MSAEAKSSRPALLQELDPQKLKKIRHLLLSLDGQDPEAQQTLNQFMRFNNDIERTNLPTREDVHFVSWLLIVGKCYFPDDSNNPFTELANTLAIAFMAKGGLKSNQFVDLFRNSPNLADLQTIMGTQEKSGGLMSRIFGRGRVEE